MKPRLPLVPGPWLPLDASEVALLLPRLDAQLAAAGLAPPAFSSQARVTDLYAVPLTFYPGWVLVTGCATLPDDSSGHFDVLIGPGFLWCVDGNSYCIHALNDGTLPSPPRPGGTTRTFPSPLGRLEPDLTGPDYLRFFCHSVRSEEATFRLMESIDDLRDSGVAEPTAHAAHATPLEMRWTDAEQTSMRAEATMLYGGSLFRSIFEVRADGGVTMLGDDALARDVAPQRATRRWLRDMREPDASAAASGAGPRAA